ncbi:MAG: hypothetical protein WBG73_09765 [Coleofasciculaceae cyanobacterium]
MLRDLAQRFSQTMQRLAPHIKLVVLLLALCVSCTPAKPPEMALKVNVQAASSPGTYNVSGTTNLPNQSPITVAAIRSLSPANQLLQDDAGATYSILDRQIVQVDQGKWQATLNLVQVAPDGRLKEAWQLGSSAVAALSPSPQVSFVAVFDPTAQNFKSKQFVSNQDIRGNLVRFSPEGVPYVQAAQSLKISLPTGRRTPPKPRSQEINGGWGNRYEIPPQPAVSSKLSPQKFPTTQTDAPLSPAEFLR